MYDAQLKKNMVDIQLIKDGKYVDESELIDVYKDITADSPPPLDPLNSQNPSDTPNPQNLPNPQNPLNPQNPSDPSNPANPPKSSNHLDPSKSLNQKMYNIFIPNNTDSYMKLLNNNV